MRKKPICPNCGDKGDVDPNLRCGVCGEQLEYADVDGTLKVAEKERKCPRCGVINSKDVKFCESCGAQIGKYCEYCKTYHFIEAKVCPKTGEPIKAGVGDSGKKSMLSRILVGASLMIILLIGFAVHRMSNKPAPPPVDPNTPVKTPVNIPVTGRPRIDVVFVIDATGSMGDEIEVVKNKIKEMIRTIGSGQPKPHVRYGLVAYRDRGDAFITRSFPLTDKTESIVSSINELEADGGGDTPESVNEALNAALDKMQWDDSTNTKKMIFLVGDAAPHIDYQQDYDYRIECQKAKKMGIKIFTIGCSGITSSGEKEFKEIANLTNGQFDYLTYRQDYVLQDGREVKILKAGDKDYMVTGGKDEEWSEGYKYMVKKKQAKEVHMSELAPKASDGGVTSTGMRYGAEPRAKGRLRNNLDQVLTQQVQMEAKKAGVRYKR